ncbi:MAG: histidine kinase [Chloroflexaceae bacterium]|nr:histidine kinase [Chloroflexaceae bacterium]
MDTQPVSASPTIDQYLDHEQVFRRLFAHSADAMLLLDGDRFIACNLAAVQLLGYESVAALLNTHPADLSPPQQPDGQPSRDKAAASIAIAHAQGSLRFEWTHLRRDGSTIPVEVLLTAVPINQHTILHVVWRDISERVRAQAALEQRVAERTHESLQRRQIAQGMHDMLTILSSDRPLGDMLDYLVLHAGRLLAADAVALFQLQPNNGHLEVRASQGLDARYDSLQIPVGECVTGRAVTERRPLAVDHLARMLQGQPSTAPPFLVAPFLLAGQFQGVLALPLLARDTIYGALTVYYRQPHTFTDEEIRLAAALSDQGALAIENARLREQIADAAIAAERNRIARDLHDSVTQTLFSASLMADVLPQTFANDPAAGLRRLEEVRLLTAGALAEMRTMLLELRPAALREVSLPELLRQLVTATSARGHVPIDLELDGVGDPPLPLPDAVHGALYRIAQESLNNVARHARASHARVTLRYGRAVRARPGSPPTSVVLVVEDDGKGFQPLLVPPSHLGLAIMRERAQEIGATLTVTSAPGQGTQVRVRWQAR